MYFHHTNFIKSVFNPQPYNSIICFIHVHKFLKGGKKTHEIPNNGYVAGVELECGRGGYH